MSEKADMLLLLAHHQMLLVLFRAITEVFIMDLWDRSIRSAPEWSTTDPSVVFQSGALQIPKYLNTFESVVLHSGVLHIPK